MPKKTQNLKADTVLKNYWSDNAQFADFFNAVLFEGKQVIQPEELEERDTEESSVLEHRNYTESMKASRDIMKVQKKSSVYGVELVLLGLENQEHIHYAMPMRVMGYDYGSYKKQYDRNAKKYKTADGIDENEYLSRMKKTDKFMPVITVVIYYGEKPWDGAKSLHEMLNIPSEMRKYVNDYKMLLVEARQNDYKLHHVNNVDLFHLLNILLDQTKPFQEVKQRAIDYTKERSVDNSVIMTVVGATNCKLDYNELTKKGELDMCTVFEKTRMEGIEEGRAEGIEKGREEGRAEILIETGYELGFSEEKILERLQKKMDISLQKAEEYFEMFRK